MIICSCNVLTKASILETAEKLAHEDVSRPVTPGRVFRALGVRPQCGTCFVTIRRLIADAGITFTCPDPLATVADEDGELTPSELDALVDVAIDAS
ncbi:MAG: (2Fe-2S)-binding protein [Bauldia sp.]|uniref:(2Fe-2S)-binding protein n=1 Tax=Bauldia sp. TaxID=2575872 RepID=UPI001D277308|nr:(2Fe-2S)-binding protein [Bauldia sp.]MCB1497052.1 (2Fe-2S)-binding protein [Bauldia sp.]